MARTTVSAQLAARTGVTPSYNEATETDGDAFLNHGETIIHILNTGDETTLTIQTPGTVDGLAIPDREVTIPATTGDKIVGPFPPESYNQSDGKVYIDWSQVTGVTFAVIQV